MGFVLDTHTHTIASAHAYSTVAEMAKAAGDRGLDCWQSRIMGLHLLTPATSCIL